MQEELKEIIRLAMECQADATKALDKNMYSPGVRMRKRLQEIKLLCNKLRKDSLHKS